MASCSFFPSTLKPFVIFPFILYPSPSFSLLRCSIFSHSFLYVPFLLCFPCFLLSFTLFFTLLTFIPFRSLDFLVSASVSAAVKLWRPACGLREGGAGDNADPTPKGRWEDEDWTRLGRHMFYIAWNMNARDNDVISASLLRRAVANGTRERERERERLVRQPSANVIPAGYELWLNGTSLNRGTDMT